MTEAATFRTFADIPDDLRNLFAQIGRGEPPTVSYLLVVAIPAPAGTAAPPGMVPMTHLVLGAQAGPLHFDCALQALVNRGMECGALAIAEGVPPQAPPRSGRSAPSVS